MFNHVTKTIAESTEMPQASEAFIPSAPVRIGDTIYVQSKETKFKHYHSLFSFEIKTQTWEESDGMDFQDQKDNQLSFVDTK